MKLPRHLIVLAVLSCHVPFLQAQSAYTPTARTGNVTPSFSFQTFDSFYDSNRVNDLSAFGISYIRQYSISVAAEYGITDDIAVDALLGWTWANMDNPLVPGNPTSIDGLNDTLLGLRWRFLDEAQFESSWVPTLTLRAGATIAGSYQAGFINSPGNGASGGDYNLLFGKYYAPWDAGVYGELSHKLYAQNVPNKFEGNIGVYKGFNNGLNLFVGYRRVQSLGGINFDSPAFNLGRFQELREISDNLEYGVSYTDGGGRTYGLTFYNVVGGQNTSKKFGVSASVNFPF